MATANNHTQTFCFLDISSDSTWREEENHKTQELVQQRQSFNGNFFLLMQLLQLTLYLWRVQDLDSSLIF